MRFIASTVFCLSLWTPVMGQPDMYSDTTYRISIHKRSFVPPTQNADASEGVTIKNSFPKGGGYTDPTGKTFGYVIFWSRIINETVSPLELTINFPADSFAIFPQPGYYLKLFLPPDQMTFAKAILYDYGAAGLKSFLDTGLRKPTMLQRSINHKEECLFYIGILIGLPDSGPARTGPVLRTGLVVLKEQDLYYRIGAVGQADLALIPVDRLFLKNEAVVGEG